MSTETRKQKREVRRLERKERIAIFDKFLAAVTAFKDMKLAPGLTYEQKIKQVWPAIRPTLEFAIVLRITGDKFDMAAQKIIVLGDSLVGKEITDQEGIDFLDQLSYIWSFIEMALEIVKIVTSDKVDEIIDKIIEIGEWIFEK